MLLPTFWAQVLADVWQGSNNLVASSTKFWGAADHPPSLSWSKSRPLQTTTGEISSNLELVCKLVSTSSERMSIKCGSSKLEARLFKVRQAGWPRMSVGPISAVLHTVVGVISMCNAHALGAHARGMHPQSTFKAHTGHSDVADVGRSLAFQGRATLDILRDRSGCATPTCARENSCRVRQLSRRVGPKLV